MEATSGYKRVWAMDVDGDGNVDVVVANGSHDSVGLYRGFGNGRFERPVLFHTGEFPGHVAMADFYGDGVPDLVVQSKEALDELANQRPAAGGDSESSRVKPRSQGFANQPRGRHSAR